MWFTNSLNKEKSFSLQISLGDHEAEKNKLSPFSSVVWVWFLNGMSHKEFVYCGLSRTLLKSKNVKFTLISQQLTNSWLSPRLPACLPVCLSAAWRTDWQTDRQTNRQTDRQNDRQTDKQIDRTTDRQTDRQNDRQTDRQTDKQIDRTTDRQTNR